MIALIIFALIVYVIIQILWWMMNGNGTEPDAVPMKWDMIKDLYLINPQRWAYKSTNWDDPKTLKYDGKEIKLSFIDFQKLKKAYRKYERNKYKSIANKNMEYIIAQAQKDIKDFSERREI